jgi:hypothetical protein
VSALIVIVSTLWTFVLQPLAEFLGAVFMTVISAIAGFLSGPLNIAFALVRAAGSSLWSLLQLLGSFLSGVFRGAIDTVKVAWDGIGVVVGAVIGGLSNLWHNYGEPLASFLADVFAGAIELAGAAWDVFSSAMDPVVGILEAIIGAAGDVIDVIGNVADAISNLPGAGVVSDIVGAIPGLAAGGIIDRPTLAMLGEQSKREVVIPLTDPARALKLATASGLFDTLARASGFARRPVGSMAASGAAPTAGGEGVVVQITNYWAAGTTPDQAAAAGNANADAVEQVLEKRRARLEAKIA